MKKGRVLPESLKRSSVDVVLLGGSAWPRDNAASCPQSRQQPSLEQGAALLLFSQLFGVFLQQDVFHGGSEGGQVPLLLHEGTTKARQSSVLSVRKHKLCLSVCLATAWMSISWGWHKTLGHSPRWLPRWDFMVVSALSLELQQELGCRGPQGVLQTLWQCLFDDCCAELKILQLWLGVQDN